MSALRGRRRRRVLLCTPEITELPEGMGNAANYVRAKGGGLGDISAGLIEHLYGHDRFELHVVLPKYEVQFRASGRLSAHHLDHLPHRLRRSGVHLVTDSAFSYLDDVYADSRQHPRIRRAEAFQRHVVNHLLDALRPDVVHCNDWMTGLIPAAARARDIPSLFTLHNVFTEQETPEVIDKSGIDIRRYLPHLYFERWPGDGVDTWSTNRVDFTATGIHAATMVNTVSPTFLAEVVAGDFPDVVPAGVRHALREQHAAGRAIGILNAPGDGMDPRTSPLIARYGPEEVLAGKARNKADLQARLGLTADPDAPLFFWPNRLYPQKAPDLMLRAAPPLLRTSRAQLVVVANGDADSVQAFRTLAARHRGAVAYRPFDEALAELARAGADFVVMPSRYEPCGLPQMECPRYGTLPVVRRTGGLRDTVPPLDAEGTTGIGFVFDHPTAEALGAGLRAAVAFRGAPPARRGAILARIMRDAFGCFSLERTAESYLAVYERLLAEAPVAPTTRWPLRSVPARRR